MKLDDAMSQSVADFGSVDVFVWAIPWKREGTQPRFDLRCMSAIALTRPGKEYEMVCSLSEIQMAIRSGVRKQAILENLHKVYRLPTR